MSTSFNHVDFTLGASKGIQYRLLLHSGLNWYRFKGLVNKYRGQGRWTGAEGGGSPHFYLGHAILSLI